MKILFFVVTTQIKNQNFKKKKKDSLFFPTHQKKQKKNRTRCLKTILRILSAELRSQHMIIKHCQIVEAKIGLNKDTDGTITKNEPFWGGHEQQVTAGLTVNND